MTTTTAKENSYFDSPHFEVVLIRMSMSIRTWEIKTGTAEDDCMRPATRAALARHLIENLTLNDLNDLLARFE